MSPNFADQMARGALFPAKTKLRTARRAPESDNSSIFRRSRRSFVFHLNSAPSLASLETKQQKTENMKQTLLAATYYVKNKLCDHVNYTTSSFIRDTIMHIQRVKQQVSKSDEVHTQHKIDNMKQNLSSNVLCKEQNAIM